MYFNGLLRPKAMFGIEPNYVTRSNHSEAGSVNTKELSYEECCPSFRTITISGFEPE